MSLAGIIRSIGVDLGWSTGATGLAVLETSAAASVGMGKGRHPRLIECTRLTDMTEILDWIAKQAFAAEQCTVAVDAPLRIGNATGMRAAERESHRLYGRYDAGCYPANQGSAFAARTTGFSDSLARLGFASAPDDASGRQQQRHRFEQFECFPHIAAIHFFGLPKILKYKKGPRAERAAALRRLRELMVSRLEIRDASAILPEVPPSGRRGRGSLKSVEDQLDAVLCAYSAYHWWRWGLARNRILGDPEEGCIIVPTAHSP